MTSRRGRRIALAAGIGVLAAAAGAWVGRARVSPEPEPAPAADAAVADILSAVLPDAAGTPVSLASYRGRPIVLNFWATWCAPCIDEMPELSAMQVDFAPLDVQILGIGVDSAANITRFAEKTPVRYPLLVADGSALDWMRTLGNAQGGLPFTVVVDRSGATHERILGRFDEPALRAAIEAAASRG